MRVLSYEVRYDLRCAFTIPHWDDEDQLLDEEPIYIDQVERHISFQAADAYHEAVRRRDEVRLNVRGAKNVRIVKVIEEVVG